MSVTQCSLLIIECSLLGSKRATALKIQQQGMKTHCKTSHISSPMSSAFSPCHHDKHICRHLPWHCRCFYPACCHQRAPRSSITLHHNTGHHPLHLWARVHHLWQGQHHVHWYDTCPVPAMFSLRVLKLFAMCTLDIDECELFHNGQAGKLCLHACVNTPGGYRCSCPAGYNVTRDGRSCKGASSLLATFPHFHFKHLSSILYKVSIKFLQTSKPILDVIYLLCLLNRHGKFNIHILLKDFDQHLINMDLTCSFIKNASISQKKGV